jgi:hypothetical protein
MIRELRDRHLRADRQSLLPVTADLPQPGNRLQIHHARRAGDETLHGREQILSAAHRARGFVGIGIWIAGRE